jgi:16S rRNA U516 pseudouridylate synthase RsuA-like enzyme
VLALYKPYGHVSRFADEAGHPGLASLVWVPDVYAAGRLDHDSEGLLLLTDDGELAHALTDPRRGHPRTYWVQVERIPDATAFGAGARHRGDAAACAGAPPWASRRCRRRDRCRSASARASRFGVVEPSLREGRERNGVPIGRQRREHERNLRAFHRDVQGVG